MAETEILHIAICQAVAILNASPEVAKLEDGRRVRDILRTALHDYANGAAPGGTGGGAKNAHGAREDGDDGR